MAWYSYGSKAFKTFQTCWDTVGPFFRPVLSQEFQGAGCIRLLCSSRLCPNWSSGISSVVFRMRHDRSFCQVYQKKNQKHQGISAQFQIICRATSKESACFCMITSSFKGEMIGLNLDHVMYRLPALGKFGLDVGINQHLGGF